MTERGDIRDWRKAMQSRCNWSWLKAAWGGTLISPSDVDFVVERRGHFLFIEQKPHRDGLTRGQEILFQNLARLSPKVTVAVLVADVDENHDIWPKEMLVIGSNEWQPIDREGLLAFCFEWFWVASNT